MSNNQSHLFHSKRRRNQSIEAAMVSISDLMTNIEREGKYTSANIGMGKQVQIDKDHIKHDFSNILPPNTMMTRQETFGERTGSTVLVKEHSIERLNLPNSPTNSVAKSSESNLNETFYSLDRNPSFDYERSAFIKEAKRISIKKSPKFTMSSKFTMSLRKSFSCSNLRSHGQGISTPIPETFDSSLHRMSNLPILNLARHTRESSFSISSPETVLTSYFSDTEDIETPESPIFHTHGENFSFTPTLRQIRSGFLNEGPSRESVGTFKIKPLALSLSPKAKSEVIKKILQEKVTSTNDYNNNINPSWRNSVMRYHHSEPNSEAERLIKSYFAETNLLRQHLYNEYNTTKHSQSETDLHQLESDAEVLLDISTGGWGGRYSTGEEVPPLLYHESSIEYFRQQLPNIQVDSTIEHDQTPTWRPESPTPTLSHQNESFQGKDRQAYPELQIKTRKSSKQLPPAIPPKSPRRPQMMMKSASHSLDFEREESKTAEIVSNFQNNQSVEQISENLVKHKDFVNERKPGVKATTHLTTSQPRMLRSSRSENALDRYYEAGQIDPLQQHERTSLTLSRLGFNSNKNFNGGGKRGKLYNLYKYNHTESVESDENLGFSTNVTPSSQRSSRLIRSVAALKSLSKRITNRKSQMFDFAQQKVQRANSGTSTINSPISSSVSPRHPSNHQATRSDPLLVSAYAGMPKNRSLSPFQQVYARAWPVKKAPKSPMVVANKTQNYF